MNYKVISKFLIIVLSVFLFISCDTEEKINYSLELKTDLSKIQLDDSMGIAIGVTPNWLRAKMIEKFKSLKPLPEDEYPEGVEYIPTNVTDPQKYFSLSILSIKDKKILDEVIYQIATTPNKYLTSFDFRISLFIENAQDIYKKAEELKYVKIVENEEDGYTTLEYKIDDGSGNITDKEIPYYYYYNYVLPLVIDDNKPFFISTRNGKFAEEGDRSKDGNLWRDYIYKTNKDERDSLKELLSSADVLWRKKSIFWGHYKTDIWENGYPDSELTLENQDKLVTDFLAEAYNDQGAIGSVIEWMMKNMIFGAKRIRPIEPSQIYSWGYGNCGEWADLTTAALRAALIPATVVSVSVDDHVWNEFYDGSWHNLEPYHPFVDFQFYDKEVSVDHEESNGWWSVHVASRARHDGFMENVTDRYSGYGDLYITVKDKSGNPIDNAIILLYGQGDLRDEGDLGLASIAYTDILGETVVHLGDNRAFWGMVVTPIGNFPIEENKVSEIVNNVEMNGTYNWDIVIDNEKPIFKVEKSEKLEKALSLKIDISLDYLKSFTNGYNIWHSSRFLMENKEILNNLDIMILSSEEFEKFKNGEEISSSYIETGKDKVKFEISLDTEEELFLVIANKNNLSTSFWSNLSVKWQIKDKELQSYDTQIYLRNSNYFALSFKIK